MRIDYLTDQFLPSDATDTIQLVTMASAFGEVGARLRLVFPARPARASERGQVAYPGVDRAAGIAAHYGVSATFEAVPMRGPYPAPLGLRGLEKLSHAGLATLRLARESASSEGVGAAAGDGAEPHIVYTRNLPIVLAALAGTRLPVFYETYRPWPAQSRSKRALFSALRRVDRFAGLILHSNLAAESYRAIGYSSDRLLVAHNGIDAARFGEVPPKQEVRRTLGLEGHGQPFGPSAGAPRPIVLYTGHVSPEKGIGLLLDASERLPELDFVIVGSRGDGPIERRAAAMPRVRVFPWQPPGQVERWLAAADILVIPPTSGPLEEVGNTVLPIKTFQYLASGRVIVAPRTRDLLEVLEDGRNARLVPPDDLDAFVGALAGLARDPALMERLGTAARTDGLANTWQARAHGG